MSVNTFCNSGRWTSVVLLIVVVAGPVHADCEWSDRIDLDDAECLWGEWQNKTWPYADVAAVQNECVEYGVVVAKVDREGARDWTIALTSNSREYMSGVAGNIRGIYCCNDRSDLCNKSDVITAENCEEGFKDSKAYDPEPTNVLRERRRCEIEHATPDPDTETCTLKLACSFWKDLGETTRHVTETRRITVPYLDVSKVVLSVDGQVSVP